MKQILNRTTEKFLLNVKMEPDGLKLFLEAEPVGAPKVTRADLLAELGELKRVEELDRGVLDDIAATLSRGEKTGDRRVLKGTPPEPGLDGRVVLLVKKFTGQGEVAIDEKGFADFRELHLFDNIIKGQKVARVYPPKPGRDGIDVLGQPIAAKAGQPARYTLEKSLSLGTETGAEYQLFVAEIDGLLVEESGKFLMKPELVINGNVDASVGSIDFIGAVKINGDVMPGVTIRGRDGVLVTGDVSPSSLTSERGDIVVNGFCRGGRDAALICGGEVKLSVAHEVRVECVGPITIGREAVECRLRTQSTVTGPKAAIIGGEALGVCGIEAKFFGTPGGLKTRLELCSTVETTTEYAQLSVAIESHEEAIRLIELHLGPLANNPARIQLLREPHRSKMVRLHQKRLQLDQSRLGIIARRQKLLESGHASELQRVNYLGALYRGCTVKGGTVVFEAKDDLTGPGSLTLNGERQVFEPGPLEPIMCVIGGRQGSPAGFAGEEVAEEKKS